MSRLFLFLLVALTACAPAPEEAIDEVRSINGTELYVRAMGGGEPIIVVHGGPMLEHGYLLPHLESLSDSYRLIFYDQRLSGRSAAEVDTNRIRMSDFVADLDSLRTSFGYEKVHVLAHSFGALIAMNYAIEKPEHLRSLILVSPVAANSALWSQEEAELADRTTAAQQEELSIALSDPRFAEGDPAAYERVMRAAMRPQFQFPDMAEELVFYRPPDLDARSALFGRIAPDLMQFDLFEAIAGVETPTLLVYGSIEPSLRLSGHSLLRTMPNAQLAIVPESGHFSFVEQPGVFLKQVREFLRGT